jgi:hypothetical protein
MALDRIHLVGLERAEGVCVYEVINVSVYHVLLTHLVYARGNEQLS